VIANPSFFSFVNEAVFYATDTAIVKGIVLSLSVIERMTLLRMTI
jgi:hypothetical protein